MFEEGIFPEAANVAVFIDVNPLILNFMSFGIPMRLPMDRFLSLSVPT